MEFVRLNRLVAAVLVPIGGRIVKLVFVSNT